MRADTGCCGNLFLGLNFIMWMIGFGTVGFAVWTLITSGNTSELVSGTLIFTYSFLGIGILLILAGLLGCIGGCCQSTCCLKNYIGIMTFILLLDIGVAIAGFVQKDSVFDITENLWNELNDETRDHIQKEIECCGYNGPTDYTTLPSSCYNGQGTQFSTSCKTAMELWVKDKIPYWASVVAAIGLIQIIATISSCATMKAIEDAMRVGIEDYS
ncbi:Leukocyte surface antigen cd53 [Mactra antiquata]